MPTVSEIPEHAVESQSVALEDQYGDFIDERLERTSFHVKTLDVVTGLIWLGLAFFGSLLILILVDHWIVGLGIWARFLSLAAITAITLYLAIQRVLMPTLRSINPEYAALTVEHAHPELKNGLISFLFFRERPDQLRPGVYRGIQQQAASDLTAVPIDSAVDRSAIIRLGYCLVALAVVWVGYILLSPKNPLQTVQRIAMPWRDIARPSQVDILEVTPGNIEVFRGQSVEIKAKVDGLKSGESPSILFSTLDGQLVDQHIVLAGNGNAGRYFGMLTTSGSGIQQDLEYRIRAGDAMSQRYEVKVTEAPHILVDRLKFDYPSYTGQTDEIVQGEGDIRAIEGTRITVVGKANQSIQRGHIDFLQSAATTSSAPKRASLKVKGSPATEAEVQFPLRMNAERNAALYRGYRLQFSNENGQTSVDPIEHTIEVIPDLRPVVQILTPERRTIELPENSWQKIEIRAVDPDFKLTRVQLAARTRGRNLFKENLLTTTRASEWQSGQFTASYRFVPSDFGLQDGDVVEYLAVAEDNRHAISQNKLDPNRTITAKQYIRIVKSDPLAEEPPRDSTSKSEDRPQDPEAQDQANDSDGSNDQQTKSEQSKNDQQSQGDSNDEQKQQGEKGSQSEEGDQSEQQESGDSQNNESGLQQNSDDGGGETQEQSEGGSPGESNESNSERESQGESSGDRSSDQANENNQGEKNDQQQDSNGGSDSQDEGEPGENAGQGDPDAQQGESGESSRDAGDENGGQGASEDEPLPSSGERDGEVVERIREHMEKTGDLDQYEKEQQEKQETGEGEAGSQDQTDAGSSQQTPEQKQDAPGADQSDSNQNESGGGEGGDPPSGGKEESDQQTSGDQGSGDQGSERQEPKDEAGQSDEQPSDDVNKSSETGKSDAGKKGDAESQGTQPGEKPSEQGTEPGESTKPQDSTESSGDPGTNDQPGDSQESGEPSTGDSETEDGPQNGEKTDSAENVPKNQGEKGAEKGDVKPSSEQTESGNNQPSDQPSESEADSGKAEGTSQDSQASKSKPSNTSKPKGATDTGDGQSTAGTDPNDTATGDDANVEYARKATDLVLEYLRDQEQKPDQELLDKLGWKQDDVDKFVRRWDEMKRNAKGSDQVSQQNKSKLDEILKGMGLESPTAKLRRSTNQDDRQRDNRNTGRKRKVPTELLDPFRAFQRGLQQNK